MTTHYDKSLQYRLSATHPHSDLVLNKKFRDWTDHITENLRTLRPVWGERYVGEKDGKLLALCQEHAKDYQRPKRGNNTAILIHPLYLHLSHMNSLNTRSLRDEADQYLHNLLNFLKANQRNPGVTVVALEIAHHYAAATSLLLEQGLIDQVLFTEYNRGSLLEVDELGKFRKDTLFFAGGYNGRCLKVSIDEMREVRDLDKSTFLSEEILKRIKERFPSQAEGKPGSIWAIRDLIINSPNDYQTLSPRRVIGSSPERTIPLEEMMRRVSITA